MKGQNTVCFVEMFFKGSVPLTLWLLVHMRLGVNFGRPEECNDYHGYMNASSTGMHLPRGSTVTLSCWPKRGGVCHSRGLRKISILQNNTEVSSRNDGSSVSIHILLDTFGKQTFICQCAKKGTSQLICGINIFVGIPPDPPKKVLCHQYGKNGSATCSWDKGRTTYLFTTYTVILLTNGTFFKENYSEDSKVDLKVNLDFESTYTVVVIATNKLGNASSQPIQFALLDIVKPYSPVNLSVKFDGSTGTNCTILWQDEEDSPHFRLRYQPAHSTSWTMLENIRSRRYELHGLKPDTEYRFQVASSFLPNKGLWSDWSISFQTEAVPLEPTDVWYLQKDVSSQTQNITLFWKARSTSERRRNSHNYRVTFQALSQKPHSAAETSSTEHTVFSQLVPKTDYNITVCSYNLRGISPAVHITTKLGITDLPPPRHLSAASEKNESIIVTWKAPLTHLPFINGYVMEWAELRQGKPLKSHPTWLKVPASNFTVKIENLKPNTCYQINVFALYQSRAGKAASTTGNASAKDISKTTPQPFPINNVHAGDEYAVWMTASTKAGESPKGNEEIIYIKKSITHKDASEWVPVLALCLAGLSACSCFVPPARQKLFSFFSVLLSGCYGKAVPDPANSSCARELTSIQDESSLHFTQFLYNPHCYEQPEPLPIEEVFMKKQYPASQTHFKNSDKGESQNCPMTDSLQKDDPTVKNLDYDPLVPNTTRETNKHQLIPLYRKVAPKEPNQGQVFSDYLANPLEDTTVDYLPTVTTTVTNNDEDSSDYELNSFSVFPRTFVSQTFSLGGKLTLDAIRMDCNFYTD